MYPLECGLCSVCLDWSSSVVSIKELIQVSLNILKGCVYRFSEIHLIELIKQGLVEPLRTSICLWMPSLGPATVNIVKIKKELIEMIFVSFEFFEFISITTPPPFASKNSPSNVTAL